jgi:hypothetical protein
MAGSGFAATGSVFAMIRGSVPTMLQLERMKAMLPLRMISEQGCWSAIHPLPSCSMSSGNPTPLPRVGPFKRRIGPGQSRRLGAFQRSEVGAGFAEYLQFFGHQVGERTIPRRTSPPGRIIPSFPLPVRRDDFRVEQEDRQLGHFT